MMAISTIKKLIHLGEVTLAQISDSAKLDSQILLSFVLQKPISYFYTWPDEQVSQIHEKTFLALLNRRSNYEPIAYITGEKEFWSMMFKVAPSTLIPRPDTEVLVETVLKHHNNDKLLCCDLGTGSGAIALALASERPSWLIDALDFNVEAVYLAQENATTLGFSDVNIYQSHWFSQVLSQKRFDIIVSNPPYIDKEDPHLTQGDVQYEPLSALVADDKGMKDIQNIAQQGRNYLKANGMIYFEHGYNQGMQVRDLLLDLGYQNIETVMDYNGNERVTFGRI
ncbi:peptide chain release factor N(5)-glutamine methyltransferase [Thalassotalea profundi]|uniref:Release factor glutamine methyltransferase n=1 Tax=Thalassotalea profundi TaxID=2036687 RepID=A0ABQ3IIW5_9GAMM|nr:peptide chain release factor N(5)-glutamine methyltransferase [Thalassotalea profundi]GHE85151.1 release factor glutamine methyltransferase [Thalassotalea profundi]